MADTDVIKKSVTAGDYAQSPGGALYLNVASWPRLSINLPPTLDDISLKDSDTVTLATLDNEAIWAGAVAIAITKIASLAWEIEGDIPLRTKRAQELLLQVDAGRGWVSFISKILQDFLLTNNGAFIEVVRATKSENSQIIGLIPLDSMRCQRTGDPLQPVIYRDLKGRLHQLRTSDVIDLSDMPSTRASMFGTGKCAAARAYKSIYKLACIETYVSDKVSGRRPLAINLVNGLTTQQLESVIQTAQAKADAMGIVSYMGAIIATIPGDTAPNVATIPLADFPDNFNRRDELDIAILAYANNLGLDVQDLQPLTGRALGTGAQSEVLNEKAKGKGLAAFRQQLVHALNQWVLPDSTTIEFIEKDWRDKKLSAEFNQVTEAYVSDSVQQGILTAPQGLQHLIDENVFPKEFAPVDETPDTTLSDTEKPEDEAVEQPLETTAPAPLVPEVTKEADPLNALIASEGNGAIALVHKIRKETQAPEKKEVAAPVSSGAMRLIIRAREAPPEPEVKENVNIMPTLLAVALLSSAMNGEGLKENDFMNLSEWIAKITQKQSQAKSKLKESPAQPPVEGVQAVMGKDDAGNTTLTILMPSDFFNQKQGGQPDIVINIPAPIVNIAAPPINIPAPNITMPQQRPPVINLTPNINVQMPERKPVEIEVKRDNYGNVLGLQEKPGE